ncbi:uncharacterized protein PV07_05082 [Cladophialophora immunda]|uniref:Kelch repeat protein n=1 Tax=Cladophialophora immunda TaxID=569365 RepID=A0A0D2AVF3_9EURO|nr:uncharacterized protein PV07_05082 [Cladophialophora immunda]KIW29257.1 hypothetical protein PV07_05082 [Cladophialophora immunda]OQV07634.1 hypothetical protein CLAIMM_12039 [Cladophialophora immunda]
MGACVRVLCRCPLHHSSVVVAPAATVIEVHVDIMLGAIVALGLAAVHASEAALIRDTILEWFWLASVADNNYLYITGGEFYEPADDVVTMYYQGNTLVVDLTQSWTNQTVTAVTSATDPDGLIYVRQPMLFYDKTRNKISRYGGWPYEEADFPSLLWSFTAGTSDVTWKNETAPSTDGLSTSSPGPFASANAFTNSTYYNFGGNVVSSLPDMTVLSGLVTRDFVAQSWTNSTAIIPNQSRYRTQARMVYTPNFGSQGFLVMVGGEAPPTEASVYETGAHMVDMSTITLYDIETGNWFTQTATGDIPPPRSEFCAVGAASRGGKRFELFVYGGSTNSTFDLNHSSDEGYLNVYALSLPAFRWFKSNSTTPVRRACHACSVIGNRQMVSIGGRLPSSLQALGAEQDPWASGLGVFDMTDFEWVDHYDAAAAAYETPDVVKQYYSDSYQEPTWSDATLATIFAFTPPANSSSNSTSSGDSGSSSDSSSGTSGSQSSSSFTSAKKGNAGAIAGGVVGGVALLAAILGLWYWVAIRRRRQARAEFAATTDSKIDYKPPLEAASTPMFEVDDNSRSELHGLSPKPQIIAELPVNEEPQRNVGPGAARR